MPSPRKSFILQEIKRTAHANGGVPLGWRKFASETGIRQRDWLGKSWARWGDALREAGFAPNQLTQATGANELLEVYATFAQELGRLPTDSELRVKATQNPGFPNTKTFGKFGTKSRLVARLKAYCQEHAELGNVLTMCEKYAPGYRDEIDGAKPADADFGYVYLIKSGRYFKIGKSNAAGRRDTRSRFSFQKKSSGSTSLRRMIPAGLRLTGTGGSLPSEKKANGSR
jgi:hypothetical protein